MGGRGGGADGGTHATTHLGQADRHTAAKAGRAALTQLGIGPQDVGDVLGAELAHALLTGLGYSIYEGPWVIPQIGIRPHLHFQPCMGNHCRW